MTDNRTIGLLPIAERELCALAKRMFDQCSTLASLTSDRMASESQFKIGDVITFTAPPKHSFRIEVDPRIYDRHSSYYIPPYFSIFGSSRPLAHHPIRLPRCQAQKNVRPKATHTNRKFYR